MVKLDRHAQLPRSLRAQLDGSSDPRHEGPLAAREGEGAKEIEFGDSSRT